MLGPLLVIALIGQDPAPASQRPPAWASFSADIRYDPSDKVERARFVQDEHGCTRNEFYYADGTMSVTLLNLPEQRYYSLREGVWTSYRTRLFEHRPRAPLAVQEKVDPVEGFDTYRRVHTVRTAGGDKENDDLVIPALNDFVARNATPESVRTAHNIKAGPQDHREFSPPEGTYLVEGVGAGPFSALYPLLIRATFPDGKPIDIKTREDGSDRLGTPGGAAFAVSARLVDERPGQVRFKVLMLVAGATPRESSFVVLEELELPLGESGTTRTLTENFSVVVTRIADPQRR